MDDLATTERGCHKSGFTLCPQLPDLALHWHVYSSLHFGDMELTILSITRNESPCGNEHGYGLVQVALLWIVENPFISWYKTGRCLESLNVPCWKSVSKSEGRLIAGYQTLLHKTAERKRSKTIASAEVSNHMQKLFLDCVILCTPIVAHFFIDMYIYTVMSPCELQYIAISLCICTYIYICIYIYRCIYTYLYIYIHFF